jgi:hypothetical protein
MVKAVNKGNEMTMTSRTNVERKDRGPLGPGGYGAPNEEVDFAGPRVDPVPAFDLRDFGHDAEEQERQARYERRHPGAATFLSQRKPTPAVVYDTPTFSDDYDFSPDTKKPETVPASWNPYDGVGAGFKVGDGVHWGAGTDTEAGTVVAVKGQRVFVVEDRFVGSGNQEYEFFPGTGKPLAFSFRKGMNRWKLAGTSVHGSMRGWGLLSHGRRKFYDYNF